MAELVLSSAMGKLESLVRNKAVPLPRRGAEKEMKAVMNDLNMTLHMFNNSGISSKKLREESIYYHWMSEVLDMAHDADVAIDIFIFNLENSIERSKAHHLDLIRERNDAIRKKIEKIKEYAKLESSSTSYQPRRSAPWIEEPNVVGLDKDVDFLLQKAVFNEDEDGVCVLSIVGMGGVGKTTLAKQVYNHERVVLNFPCRAWVYVSSEFSEADLLREVLVLLGVEYKKVRNLNNNGLRDMVSERLEGTRYFIVLDDVWRDADLANFMTVFNHQGKASRLLLTSRTRNIIRDAHYIHEMNILDRSESWKLFVKTVFNEKYTKCPNHLEEIGRKIVTKCNGLPLAIVVVGSQLSYKKHLEKEWERFLVETMDLSAVSSVLELSYHKLPPKLKSCFLHLVLFKEGTTIRVEKLIDLWTTGWMLSQGEAEHETDEEIGRKCLDELVNQYMVEVKDLSSKDNSHVKNCCINSNLHRLAVTKAEDEIRFEILRSDGSSLAANKPRHGAINCSREKFDYSTNQLKHLVSLFFRGGLHFDVNPSYWKSFELLKRLDFEGFGLKTLSEMVGKLVCLQYLGLRNNFLQDVPHSLSSLERLEVLDLAQNFMVKLPDIVRKMGSLRHLYMSDIICWEPLMIDSLMNLQTLTYISVDSWMYELSGLEMMHSLRKLGIEEFDGASDVSKIFASLVKLENLECLILRGFHFRSMPSLDELGILNSLTQLKLDGVLPRLPSPNCFPPKICYLTLANSSLDEDPMPVLENLSELGFVKLRNAFTGEQMMVSKFGFAKLRVLCIGELWNLKSLQVGEGAMPKLEQVEIQNCPHLKVLPQEIMFTKCIARNK